MQIGQTLASIREHLATLSPQEIERIERMARAAVKDKVWIPSPGPQTMAYYSQADICLYGGQGGGGKSDLLLGLALTQHTDSLIMRRTYPNLAGLTRRIAAIAGRKGLKESPPPRYRTPDGRLIEFGAAQHVGDEQDFQGQPHDLLGFDEATQFAHSQVRFLMGWVRSATKGQRKRTVLATNPPLDSVGFWIISMFRPWLDITHPNPAEPGELRWYITDADGSDVEVQDSNPISRDGHTYIPTSRTFIPAALSDNPYLVDTGYQAQLDALPEPLRSAVRDGNFMAARQDADFQIIPTLWVVHAQSRWRPDGWKDQPMTCMAVDPNGGGSDPAVIGARHGLWFSEITNIKQRSDEQGSSTMAAVVRMRRNGCPVVVDVGGGYGGALISKLEDNQIPFQRFDGSAAARSKTLHSNLLLVNKRIEALWRLREALDPEQVGGSHVALPPDPELLSDLTASVYKTYQRGIIAESKDEIRKKLNRSPGKGDVAMMLYQPGHTASRAQSSTSGAPPKVLQSRQAARRRGR